MRSIRDEVVNDLYLLEQDVSDPGDVGLIRNILGDIKVRDKLGVFNLRSDSQHESLDTLVHNISENSYEEFIYSGSLVTSVIIWETSGKLKKIREEVFSYSGSRVNSVTTYQYDENGDLKLTMTETYSYTGSRVTSITRVIS